MRTAVVELGGTKKEVGVLGVLEEVMERVEKAKVLNSSRKWKKMEKEPPVGCSDFRVILPHAL